MIRPATQDDAAWIMAMWNAVISDTLVTFTTTPKSVGDIATLIQRRPVLVLPEARGFATYGPFRAGPGYGATIEHSIYLAPACRGQGLGGGLLDALMDHAAGAGHHVSVAAISGANPGAVRFHAQRGFESVGRMAQVGRKNGQWLDLILMQKLLNPQDNAAEQR